MSTGEPFPDSPTPATAARLALKHAPGDAALGTTLAEACQGRAAAFAAAGDWPKAAAAFANAAAFQGDDPSLWYQQAMAHLAGGDREAYRRTCGAMLQRFAQTKDHAVAARVVFTCVPAPGAVADFATVIRLAEMTVEAHEVNARVLGAALYRAGKYEQAVVHLEKSV